MATKHIKEIKRKFEDVTIEVPWGHVAGRWYGNCKVRPILALHGWQDNLGTWDRLIPLLPHHIGILCIDFPGHGRSSKYPSGTIYHVHDYAHLIMRIVEEYKWRKVSLMGHSMGAIVSFVYAALYPHMVDMLIQIDIVKSASHPVDIQIGEFKTCVERSLIENERLETLSLNEPPSYLYQELEDLLHYGSGQSVNKENCKFLLNRSITKSLLYPDRYYFSRDGRVKNIVEMSGEHGLFIEMAKRIKNIAYILIRSDTFTYFAPNDEQILDVLRANNRHFQYHTIFNSTHHLHLNDGEAVAAIINPFVLKYRPSSPDTWAVDDSVNKVNESGEKSKL